MSFAERMSALCEAFNCLQGRPGVRPWDPALLAEQYGTCSGGERACIAFVLYVWNTSHYEWQTWAIPPFTLTDFARMDDHNQRAVAAWFAEPFWP